jgi:hypothetical protein
MESYECHTCVPGGTSAVNLNLHTGGFHLYPHIHGTGGGEIMNVFLFIITVEPLFYTFEGTK